MIVSTAASVSRTSLALGAQALEQHGALVDVPEALGERPQDVAVDLVARGAGRVVVGVQEPDDSPAGMIGATT